MRWKSEYLGLCIVHSWETSVRQALEERQSPPEIEGTPALLRAQTTHPDRRAQTDAHTQTHTHRRTQTDAHTQTHTHRRTHTDAHTQTHTHRRTHTDAHTQTHTHRRTHTDAPTQTHPPRRTHPDKEIGGLGEICGETPCIQ